VQAQDTAGSDLPSGLVTPDIAFIENAGQWGDHGNYRLAADGMEVWLTDTGFRYVAINGPDVPEDDGLEAPPPVEVQDIPEEAYQGHVVQVDFLGANRPSISELGAQPGTYNWLVGPDEQHASGLVSHTSIPVCPGPRHAVLASAGRLDAASTRNAKQRLFGAFHRNLITSC